MPAFGAVTFRGEAPAVTPRLLPDGASQEAVSAKLYTGDLASWRAFALEKVLANAGPVSTIYLMADAYWLSWTQAVDVARGTVPGDTTYRTYITGLDQPRFTTLALATSGAEPFPVQTRPLGVPAPQSPPGVEAGVDPSPTSFTIDVLDEGDQLATAWTVSPYRPFSD